MTTNKILINFSFNVISQLTVSRRFEEDDKNVSRYLQVSAQINKEMENDPSDFLQFLVLFYILFIFITKKTNTLYPRRDTFQKAVHQKILEN